MTDDTHQTNPVEEVDIDLAFGKAVARGALIGLPVMLVFISVSVWLITDKPIGESITASLLAGILMGVFGGGFIGVLTAMRH